MYVARNELESEGLRANYHYATLPKRRKRKGRWGNESKHLSSFTIKVGFRRRHRRRLRGTSELLAFPHSHRASPFVKSFNPHGLCRRLISVYLICKTRRCYMREARSRESVGGRKDTIITWIIKCKMLRHRVWYRCLCMFHRDEAMEKVAPW